MKSGFEMSCANCNHFDGEKYDGYQFCDEREIDVYEDGYCSKWKSKKSDD